MNIFNLKKKRTWSRLLLLLLVTLALIPAMASAQDGVPDTSDPNVTILEEIVGRDYTRTTIEILALQDTFIASGQPTTNFGTDPNLRIGYEQGPRQAERTLLQFSLSAIPSGATINSASFQIYQNQATPIPDTWFNGQFAIQARYLASSWNQYSVTWNSHLPVWGDVIGVGETNTNSGLKSANATDVVRAWYSGSRPNYGILLQGDESPDRGRQRIFDSYDRSGGYKPRLIVDYTLYVDNCPPTANVNSLPAWSQSSFTVSWSGTDCGTGGQPPSGISHYDVQYSTNNSNWTQWLSGTSSTSSTFHGLNGTSYFFRVRAQDKAGNIGAWSSSKNTRVDTVAPTASINIPGINVNLEGYNFPSFQVFWSGSDNLSGLKQYNIEFRERGLDWQRATFPPSQTSEWVTGATVGKTYDIRVQSVDNAGNVSNWDTAETTIVNDPSSIVLPFEPPLIQDSGSVPFTVNWIGFASTVISNYEVKYRANDGPWITWNNYPGTQSSAPFDPTTIPGWDANEVWRIDFEVAARSQGGIESFSGKAEATILVDLSGQIQPALYFPLIFRYSQ